MVARGVKLALTFVRSCHKGFYLSVNDLSFVRSCHMGLDLYDTEFHQGVWHVAGSLNVDPSFSSWYNVHVILTPLHILLLYSKTWVYKDIRCFSYFCS